MRPICILLVATSAIASNPAYSEAEKIQGCWRFHQTELQFANGTTQQRDTNCLAFFDDSKEIMTCGKPYSRAEYPYSIPEPGKIKFGSRVADFSADKGTLAISMRHEPNEKVPVDQRNTRTISKASRLAGASVDECLPATIKVTAEDIFRILRIRDLVIASVEAGIRGQVLTEFLQEGFRQPVPEGAISPADLKRLLTEFDLIADGAASHIRPLLDKDKAIEKIFYSPGYFSADMVSPTIIGDDQQRWADDAIGGVIAGKRMTAYLRLSALFESKKFQNWQSRGDQVSKSGYGLGREFGLERELLLAFSETPELAGLVPKPEELIQNARLIRESDKFAQSKYMYSLSGLERGVELTAQKIYADRLPELFPESERKTVSEKIRRLITRVKLLGPRTWDIGGQPVCAFGKLDPSSVSKSKGNWKELKTINGKMVNQGSWEHYAAFVRYVAGCDGPKDFVAARKVLEEIVSLESPPIGHGKECDLAHWYRYGIGGEKSEKKATALEKSFASWASVEGRTNNTCPPGDRIDPRNPWTDLY